MGLTVSTLYPSSSETIPATVSLISEQVFRKLREVRCQLEFFTCGGVMNESRMAVRPTGSKTLALTEPVSSSTKWVSNPIRVK